MKEFMLIFRMDFNGAAQLSPEQMQESVKYWQDWIGGVAAQGKFTSTNQLSSVGKTLKPGGVITDGPYAEVKEIVGGYLNIKEDSLEAAMKIAEGCPILHVGGNVEVREITPMNF
jgi:hypothetical protein